ncbi:MAG TPA: cytochrome c-type biogenesis protein [Dongiaceae bacterium]|nr:cytochrome c-type biogenesis protein [Dongiaceae bacterium]
MTAWRIIVAALLWLLAAPVFAQEQQLADPALEQRARTLSYEIRCVVCQSQSIAESEADIARDMRTLIREQIAAGKSDQEIRAYLVARYGDFILFQPPFKATTYALWIGPFAVLVLALIGVIVFFRRRAAQPAAARELSAAERNRVAEMLRDEEGRS